MAVFGCRFYQAFGMTETGAAATLLPDDHDLAITDRAGLLASCGRPMLGTEIRIVDADRRELPTGSIGEIAVRGPQLMGRYWRNEQATRKSLVDGWFHTGDVGYLDKDGYLYITSRLVDVIVVGGMNIYPTEVEGVISGMPEVHEVAVIGVPHDTYGETVMAVVVPASSAVIDIEQIRQYCEGRLASYKWPRLLTIVTELPRNAMGKVLKSVLREPHWADRDRLV
jgi:acyl-CoA synthetase (AMP-forming)/AMP-acid ligase II